MYICPWYAYLLFTMHVLLSRTCTSFTSFVCQYSSTTLRIRIRLKREVWPSLLKLLCRRAIKNQPPLKLSIIALELLCWFKVIRRSQATNFSKSFDDYTLIQSLRNSQLLWVYAQCDLLFWNRRRYPQYIKGLPALKWLILGFPDGFSRLISLTFKRERD